MRISTLCVAAASVFVPNIALASLTLVANANTTHVGNLVTNGSFENVTGGGPLGNGLTNQRYWATGTAITPFAVPTGWSSSGNASSYAVWGNDDNSAYWLRDSDNLPDGNYAMYFGNGGTATVTLAPTFNANGTVSFAGTPTVTSPSGFTVPVTLSQTIPTSSNPAPKYALSFWVSGEGARSTLDSTGLLEGIFALRMTNVLAGNPRQFLAVPSAPNNPLGASIQFDYEFVPLNPSIDVSIEFINYGHFDLNAYGRAITTELVLDDVIVNAVVPEPALPGLVSVLCAATLGLRRR